MIHPKNRIQRSTTPVEEWDKVKDSVLATHAVFHYASYTCGSTLVNWPCGYESSLLFTFSLRPA
jgi:hypothetical protein